MGSATQEPAEGKGRRPEARLALGLFMVVVSLFLLLSVASYDPGDPPLADYPVNPVIRNLGGAVGAFLGGLLRLSLGGASYLLLAVVGWAGCLLVVNRRVARLKIKLISGTLLIVSAACLLDLAFNDRASTPSGPGGVVGRLLNTHIFLQCGWGAWLALVAMFGGSLVFLTDFAPIRLAGKGIRWWRKRRFERAKMRGIVDAGPERSSAAPRDPAKQPLSAADPPPSLIESQPAGPTRRPHPDAPPVSLLELFDQAEDASQTHGPSFEGPPADEQAAEPADTPAAASPAPTEADREGESAVASVDPPDGSGEPTRKRTPEAEPEAPPSPPLEDPDRRSEDTASHSPNEAPHEDASVDEALLGEEDEAEEPEDTGEAEPPPPPKPKLVGEEFKIPSSDLLDPEEYRDYSSDDTRLQQIARMLENTLDEFNVDAQVVEVDRGPVITMYEIELAPGIKIGKIVGLADDIARALSASSVRIVAPIPGKSTVGIEVPNPERETVRLRDIFESGVLDRKQLAIPMLIGKDASGQPLVSDLAQMPHCLIAGATGTGKSVCMNSLIVSLLLTQHPDRLKLLLIDPKMVEFAQFKEVPHLLAPVVTDMKKATSILEWATAKMDERYEFLAAVGARNIVSFNSLGEDGIRERLGADEEAHLDDFPTYLPYIVIVIDELADLMMVANKEVENSIIRLAQKSRAVGIHLIIATQRPSVDVITGLIKSNLPSRIALQVASKVDSRTILDRNGAEKLLGQGDMLFLPPGSSKLIRAQGAFVSDAEIRRIVQTMKKQDAKPIFDDDLVRQRAMGDKMPWERDELFCEAVKIVAESQRGSVSLLQRRLTVGYSRAARLIDMMAEMGLVGEYKGSQAREVTVTPEEWEEMMEQYEQA